MKKITFVSDELPSHWDDHARFAEWKRLFTDCYRPLDVSRAGEGRFSMRFEFARFGPIGLGEFAGSPIQIGQAPRKENAPDEDVVIDIDRGSAPLLLSHESRDAVAERQPHHGAHHGADGRIHHSWTGLVVPRRQLLDVVADVDVCLDLPLDPDAPAVRHLKRYLDILGGRDGIAGDPLMRGHIGTTLLDLIARAIAPGRGAEPAVRNRGARALRLHDVLARIEADFADPAFSVRVAARQLQVSARYIQDLLQGTGSSFTERVTELRLQKARAMLLGDRYATLKVSDLALSCGFNEVSYFHRCFRRRFGISPAQFRARNGLPP